MPRMNIKVLSRRPKTNDTTRYEARFINGIWTVFDRWNYGHGLPLGSGKEARNTAARLNAGELKWAA